MLVLSRKPGQRILIGEDIALVILDVRPDGVKLGIEAPRSIPIYREELLQEIRHLNQQATQPMSLPSDIEKPLLKDPPQVKLSLQLRR
ncbi:MAG: carbon storage regulator [Vampirovibrionales bacterium]|nr:carbon storage regulator [Vampirovibrionales bacterium]